MPPGLQYPTDAEHGENKGHIFISTVHYIIATLPITVTIEKRSFSVLK